VLEGHAVSLGGEFRRNRAGIPTWRRKDLVVAHEGVGSLPLVVIEVEVEGFAGEILSDVSGIYSAERQVGYVPSSGGNEFLPQ
jgi:hypothetical protein